MEVERRCRAVPRTAPGGSRGSGTHREEVDEVEQSRRQALPKNLIARTTRADVALRERGSGGLLSRGTMRRSSRHGRPRRQLERKMEGGDLTDIGLGKAREDLYTGRCVNGNNGSTINTVTEGINIIDSFT